MKDVFIPTQNFQRFQELCGELLGSSMGIELAAVLGRAGRGKTTAAERMVTMNPQTVYVRFQRRFIRDFHDVCKIPVIMIGEESLRAKLERERRLVDRVREELAFEPVVQGDVVVFYRKALELGLKSEHAARLLDHAKGNFRKVKKDAAIVERVMKVSGIKEITESVVKDVCKGA